jgi:hypothetical protein
VTAAPKQWLGWVNPPAVRRISSKTVVDGPPWASAAVVRRRYVATIDQEMVEVVPACQAAETADLLGAYADWDANLIQVVVDLLCPGCEGCE